jgi:hypothetical protein
VTTWSLKLWYYIKKTKRSRFQISPSSIYLIKIKNKIIWVCVSFKFRLCLFPGIQFPRNHFQTFLCLFDIRKVSQRKTLFSQRKIWFGFQESVFLKNLGGKHFPEVVKNLEMSYYLLIISNLVLKLLIAIYIYIYIYIYIVSNIYFSISSLKI